LSQLGKSRTARTRNHDSIVNRLSDLLFVLSRVLNRHAGGGDVLWEKGRQRG